MMPVVENDNYQYVDPEVTKPKFHIEMERFYFHEPDWNAKGVFLLREDYPLCEFLFLTPQVEPFRVSFGVEINFINYDAEPPSVRFIDPFTGRSLKRAEIPLTFKVAVPAEVAKELKIKDHTEGVEVCLSIKGKPPFFCHPGFREYHKHPYHTGNSWWLHRGSEGRLYRILELLHKSSIGRVAGIEVKKTKKGEIRLTLQQRKP